LSSLQSSTGSLFISRMRMDISVAALSGLALLLIEPAWLLAGN